MLQKVRHNIPTVVGLGFLVGANLFLFSQRSILREMPPTQRILAQLIFAWIVTLFLLVLVVLWERKPLSSIGIRRMSRKDVLWAVVGFLLGGVIIMGTMPLVQRLGLSSTENGVRHLMQLPIWLRMAMVLTTGVSEEILYRGYLIERLDVFSGRIGLSASLSWFVFVALHLPFWGLGGAIQIGLGSIVLYALYVWRRNLPACMLMHILNNAVALLLVPTFLS